MTRDELINKSKDLLSLFNKKFKDEDKHLGSGRPLSEEQILDREMFIVNNDKFDIRVRIITRYVLRRQSFKTKQVDISAENSITYTLFDEISNDRFSILYQSGYFNGYFYRNNFQFSVNSLHERKNKFNPFIVFNIGSLIGLNESSSKNIFESLRLMFLYVKEGNISFAINISSTERYLESSVTKILDALNLAKKEGLINDVKHIRFEQFVNSYAGSLNYTHYILVGDAFEIKEIDNDNELAKSVQLEYDKNSIRNSYTAIHDYSFTMLSNKIFSLNRDGRLISLENPMRISGISSFCCGDSLSYPLPIENGKGIHYDLIDKSIANNENKKLIALAMLNILKNTLINNRGVSKQMTMFIYDENMWDVLEAIGFRYKFSMICDKSGIEGRMYVFTKEGYKIFSDELKKQIKSKK